MATLSKVLSPAVAESAGAGDTVSTKLTRRSRQLQQARKQSLETSPTSPAPAFVGQARKGRRHGPPSPRRKCDQEMEESRADEVEAMICSGTLFYLTAEEVLPYYKRLYKKRANLSLAWYYKNNPEDQYEFTGLQLNEVCNFMDGGVCYIHMNFRAMNMATRSEKRFFAELALKNDVFDENNGYTITTCSTVDDNCAGGMREMLGVKDGLPKKRLDEDHCYACAKNLKHPAGISYEGGHYAEDYGVVNPE